MSALLWNRIGAALPFSAIHNIAAFERLKANAVIRHLPKRSILVTEGERPDHLYVIADGRVEVLARYQARTTTLEIWEGLAAFPLDAVVCDLALETMRALSIVTLIGFPAEAVRIALRQDGGFARGVAETLANEKRRSTALRKQDRLLTGAQRVAYWALKGADHQTGRVDLRVSKHVLAAQLSMAPANFSRTLALLNGYGLLNKGRPSMSLIEA